MNEREEMRRKMAVAIQLHETGLRLMRQTIRRRMNGASDAEVEREFQRWLIREDDAIPGDVAGAVRVRKMSL